MLKPEVCDWNPTGNRFMLDSYNEFEALIYSSLTTLLIA